jgi:hypothetical protein
MFSEHLAVKLSSVWFPIIDCEQSLENTDYVLTATLYSHISDSYVGLAGLDNASTSHSARLRATNMARAELYIDRARECKFSFSLPRNSILFSILFSVFPSIDGNKCSQT